MSHVVSGPTSNITVELFVELYSFDSDRKVKERESLKLQAQSEKQRRSQNRQLSGGQVDLNVW